MRVYRGDIWLVDLKGAVGSEQLRTRPCVVISNNIGNEHSPIIIVCPITSKPKKFAKTHMPISGLIMESVVLCEQVRTVDKRRLIQLIGKASEEEMDKLRDVMMLTLAL